MSVSNARTKWPTNRTKPCDTLAPLAGNCKLLEPVDPDEPTVLTWMTYMLICTSRCLPLGARLNSSIIHTVSTWVLDSCIADLVRLSLCSEDTNEKKAARFLWTMHDTKELRVLLAREVLVYPDNQISCNLQEDPVVDFMYCYECRNNPPPCNSKRKSSSTDGPVITPQLGVVRKDGCVAFHATVCFTSIDDLKSTTEKALKQF